VKGWRKHRTEHLRGATLPTLYSLMTRAGAIG
jgi:hypothetical protein